MIQFTSREVGKKQSCANCLFEHERAKVCMEMTEKARLASLPDCDDLSPSGNYIIYIAKDLDSRQVDLF